MKRLSEEDINEINNDEGFDSWYQGIFREAYGVPNDMKEEAVYIRWSMGGASGGNCWGDDAEYFEGDEKPDFVVLEKALMKIVPTLSFLHFKEIERNITSSSKSDYEYYGNYQDWEINFIPLSTIYKVLEKLGY